MTLIAGSISMKVMRRKVCQREAPHHAARRFQRRIHGAERIDDEQEQERRRILHHVPDDAAVGIRN